MRKQILSLAAIFCALALIFTACGSNNGPSETENPGSSEKTDTKTEESTQKDLSLPYNAEDSLSPVKLKGDLNDRLSVLFYDSLYQNDGSFTPVASMAESCSVQGKTCIVTLKSGLKFSNGREVKASDVVASFRALKNSTAWASRLSGISSAAADGKMSVCFTLSRENQQAVSLLDFPIMQADSVNWEMPVGSGPFVAKKEGESYTVSTNPQGTQTETVYSGLKLYNITARSLAFYAVKTGAIDLLSATMTELAENRGSYLSCNSLNLVYLGINVERSRFAKQKVRQLLEYGIGRTALSSESFSDLASNTYFPLHPESFVYLSAAYDTSAFTEETAKQLAEELNRESAGWNAGTITLLVSNQSNYMTQAAKQLTTMLKEYGLKVEEKLVTLSELKTAVAAKNYDLYLGQVHLERDQDLSVFFEGESLIPSASCTASRAAWTAYQSDSGELTAFLDVFSKEVPFVPLAYTDAIVMVSHSVDWELTPTEATALFGIENWKKTQPSETSD